MTETSNSKRNADEFPLRVDEIEVKGLFGVYHHIVKLNAADRLTIIHGPNGVGKTAFLRLTHALLTGKYGDLAKTPFSEFSVKFSDGSKGGIRKPKEEKNSGKSDQTVVFYQPNTNELPLEATISQENLDPERLAERIERESPYLMRMGPDQWVDRRFEELLTSTEVVSRYSENLPEKVRHKILKDLPQLKEIRKKFNSHFIEAQRLIKLGANNPDWRHGPYRERSVIETVQDYSRDLKKRVSETLNVYAKESQRLDQTFPQRLLGSIKKARSISELKADFSEIEEQRAKLKRIGLIDDTEDSNYPFNISSLDDTQATVMSLYIEDTRAKLGTLKDLALRIEILLDNINKKFKNKQLKLQKDSGLIAIGPNGQDRLSLSALSSGEQHEIVLIYDLLFKVNKNTLVLIDEPELSLHVSWQKTFLEDLSTIIDIAEFDVLMATHSPFIVGDRSDLMVALSTNQPD